jgi:F-type H+-transporting ATPase subunit c
VSTVAVVYSQSGDESVKKLASVLGLSILAVLVMAAPAAAAGATGSGAWIEFSGALGAGLTVVGAAYGIGRLASSAVESMARQPEVAGNVQVAMIISAALIEGFTFFALYICMLQNPWPQ